MTQQHSSTGNARTQEEYRPLKRVLVKEEFVALTGDFSQAVVLGQLEYWQKRVRDIDRYIVEEKQRASKDGKTVEIEEAGGWIYKTAPQMIEETMLTCSSKSMNRYFDQLVEDGIVDRRRNPHHKWDRTYQYRINLVELSRRLKHLGYNLEGWKLEESVANAETTNEDHRNVNMSLREENMSLQNDRDVPAIPEITTETTNSSSSEPTFAEQEPFDINDLPDDTTTACLILLSRVKGFPRDTAANALYLGELRSEFPQVAAREVVRDFEVWNRENETKPKGMRTRLRNFFKSASKNSGGVGQVAPIRRGESVSATSATPEAGIRGLREWTDKNDRQRLAPFAQLAERFDFTGEAEPPWPILARLGQTEDERTRNLKACRNIARRWASDARKEVG